MSYINIRSSKFENCGTAVKLEGSGHHLETENLDIINCEKGIEANNKKTVLDCVDSGVRAVKSVADAARSLLE